MYVQTRDIKEAGRWVEINGNFYLAKESSEELGAHECGLWGDVGRKEGVCWKSPSRGGAWDERGEDVTQV